MSILRGRHCGMSSSSVADNLKGVLHRIKVAYENAPPEKRAKCLPSLIAVSKTKPKEDIIEAYNAGQRVFGENYVQELYEKSRDPEIQELCPQISWHFIGTLQSKNVNKLLRVPRLDLIHSVASIKLAQRLQGASERPLDVLVQVNTSGEASKGGVAPGEEAVDLVGYILASCPRLRFGGLMSIGAYNAAGDENNGDFRALLDVRTHLAKEFQLPEGDLRLSMGMSGDLEAAVAHGSTDVRLGRAIFGERAPKVK